MTLTTFRLLFTLVLICLGSGRAGAFGSDPFFVATEFEQIQSKSILFRVAANLGLEQRWSDAKGGPQAIPMATVYAMMRGGMSVRQSPNSELFEVTMRWTDPAEAAEIANEVAKVYQAFKLEEYRSAPVTNRAGVWVSPRLGSVRILSQAEPAKHPLFRRVWAWGGLGCGLGLAGVGAGLLRGGGGV